jgi:hypothetical protein
MLYHVYILKWIVAALDAIGSQGMKIGDKLLHDPLWTGTAVAIVALIGVLLVVKARISRI